MEYVAALLRGDLAEAAELSFDCVMCGLCTVRCPAEITQYQAAMYAAGGRPLRQPAAAASGRTARRAQRGEVGVGGRGTHKARCRRAEEVVCGPGHETPTGGFAKAVGK